MIPDFCCPPPGLTLNVNELGDIVRQREVMPGLERLPLELRVGLQILTLGMAGFAPFSIFFFFIFYLVSLSCSSKSLVNTP